MASESYQRHVRGLQMLGELHGAGPVLPVRSREDYRLAERALDSLRLDVEGAGSNTWRRAKERYRRARAWFEQLPTPCEATLHNVDGPCQRVGYGGACDRCRAAVKNAMRYTCARYGIALD